MPRKFTEFELKMIHQQLLKAGKTLIEQQGFQKTSIDQMVHAVGISKGSFYRFFKNKESLFFHIIDAFEREIYEKTILQCRKDCEHMSFLNAYEKFIVSQFKAFMDEPIYLQSSNTTFISNLWSKLPIEDQEKSVALDLEKINAIECIANKYGYRHTKTPDVTVGILRSLAFLLMHPSVLEPHYQEISDFHMKYTLENIFQKTKRDL